jgi:hypothetical protein
VSCIGSLEHYQDMSKGLEELLRVAKSGAKIFIVVPNKEYFLWKLKMVPVGTKQREFEVLKDLDEWKSLFESFGLNILKVKQDRYPMKILRVFEKPNLITIARRLIYKGIWLFVPIRYTYQFVFVAIKR